MRDKTHLLFLILLFALVSCSLIGEEETPTPTSTPMPPTETPSPTSMPPTETPSPEPTPSPTPGVTPISEIMEPELVEIDHERGILYYVSDRVYMEDGSTIGGIAMNIIVGDFVQGFYWLSLGLPDDAETADLIVLDKIPTINEIAGSELAVVKDIEGVFENSDEDNELISHISFIYPEEDQIPLGDKEEEGKRVFDFVAKNLRTSKLNTEFSQFFQVFYWRCDEDLEVVFNLPSGLHYHEEIDIQNLDSDVFWDIPGGEEIAGWHNIRDYLTNNPNKNFPFLVGELSVDIDEGEQGQNFSATFYPKQIPYSDRESIPLNESKFRRCGSED